MYLSKKRNGIYYIYYNQLNGKRTSKTTGTKYKAEALRYLSGFESIIKHNQKLLVIPITLKKFKFEFIKYFETIHSVKYTKSLITSFNMLIKYYGDIELTELTREKLQEYIEHRLRKLSPYAVKRDIANFSSSFNWGISKNFLNSNPSKIWNS